MATKQTGNLYPLIVSDIYGVIVRGDEFDKEYLKLLKQLSKNRKVVIYSSMSEGYIKKLLKYPELGFVSGFYSANNGWSKHIAQSYKLLAQEERIDTSDIIFIDDSSENVSASEQAGCAGVCHYDASQTKKTLLQLGVQI